jgi:hypothetical protein
LTSSTHSIFQSRSETRLPHFVGFKALSELSFWSSISVFPRHQPFLANPAAAFAQRLLFTEIHCLLEQSGGVLSFAVCQ